MDRWTFNSASDGAVNVERRDTRQYNDEVVPWLRLERLCGLLSVSRDATLVDIATSLDVVSVVVGD